MRDFWRDSPTNRPDAGDSNGGTGKDIHDHGTATHCSHVFASMFEFYFGALQRPTFIGQRRLVLRHFKLFSAFFIEVRQTLAHLNSNRLVEQSGYSSEHLRVFSDQLPRVRR
jgi:hypothetical protein